MRLQATPLPLYVSAVCYETRLLALPFAMCSKERFSHVLLLRCFTAFVDANRCSYLSFHELEHLVGRYLN